MKALPPSPDLAHLRKQAKTLLREARAAEPPALRRFLEHLPAARRLDTSALEQHALKLHDAQSVIAREYGFASWIEFKRYVDWTRSDAAKRLESWLRWVCEGNPRQRRLALRMLGEEPELFADDWVGCLIGDEMRIRAALARDPDWVHRPGGPAAMPPLVAVTHSKLMLEDGFEAGLLACATLLIDHGADPNGVWISPDFPDSPLSALYGASGRTRHAGMTALLLGAGADPNDGESLYHSVESADPHCTQLLLDAGARVTGSNAIARVLDYDRHDRLTLLLAAGGDAREKPWIHHAILRGRSLAQVRALVEAGADLRAENGEGISLFRWAQMHGRSDVVDLLRAHAIDEPLTEPERFVAACTRGDEANARAIRQARPGVFAELTQEQLETMPRLAAVGAIEAVRTMLALGWPREVKTGWGATALNLAIFRGDAAMARLLLENGADWRTLHGHGDTALGTLSFASQFEEIEDDAPRDYLGCAQALVASGVTRKSLQAYAFSDAVTAFVAGLPTETDR